MPFGILTWMGPRNHVSDGGPDPPCKGEIFRRDDVGIFPHAAKHHSQWPLRPDFWLVVTEAVECHIKFSRWKSPPLHCGLVYCLSCVTVLFIGCYCATVALYWLLLCDSCTTRRLGACVTLPSTCHVALRRCIVRRRQTASAATRSIGRAAHAVWMPSSPPAGLNVCRREICDMWFTGSTS